MNDLEVEGERLQSELSRLGGVLAELEEEGVEGGERERPVDEDATVCVYSSHIYFELEHLLTTRAD